MNKHLTEDEFINCEVEGCSATFAVTFHFLDDNSYNVKANLKHYDPERNKKQLNVHHLVCSALAAHYEQYLRDPSINFDFFFNEFARVLKLYVINNVTKEAEANCDKLKDVVNNILKDAQPVDTISQETRRQSLLDGIECLKIPSKYRSKALYACRACNAFNIRELCLTEREELESVKGVGHCTIAALVDALEEQYGLCVDLHQRSIDFWVKTGLLGF